MHRHWLDAQPDPVAKGPLRRVPAGVKMGVAVGLVVLLVAVPVWWSVYGAVAVVLVALAWVARVSWGVVARRMILAEPFVIGVAVLSLVQPHGGRLFAAVLVRSTLCVGVLVLLGAVTPFSEMLATLKRLRVPSLMVTTLALMQRYLTVLGEESHRMRRARASRSFVPGRRRAWQGLSSVLSQLFVRASARSERIYAAMCSRGWE
jgi:cobalt/nickel transport system permease protein